MSKKVLGLDLGSNSIGWALMREDNGKVSEIIDLGSRIFNKAVKEGLPTPKNKKRRDMRLGRRVLQRRARRKQKMINYLISLDLLPKELSNNFSQEKLLNELGDPYELRTKGLDKQLTPHEFGRILLHFVARRGFLSSKKQIAGDLVNDPDTQTYLSTLDSKQSKGEEKQFKADIAEVYKAIKKSKARTLGEFLYHKNTGEVKRNRSHDGGHLRTDRAMYKDELQKIWQTQQTYFDLPDNFIEQIEKIIFYQRPLKLKKDRVGKCSLEKNHYRANNARLEAQRFRYLQDVNNLKYFERQTEKELTLNNEQKNKLKIYLEQHRSIEIKKKLPKELGLDKSTKIKIEAKNLKGNITACKIRAVIGDVWDQYSAEQQFQLFEDLFTIKKKSALKKRLITHWDFDKQTAVKLCLLEFEPSHSNLSLKAIKKLLPFLEQGLRYNEARVKAEYGYETEASENLDKLPAPPETSNPIVNKGLHELRRVVNAIIKQHSKPDVVRIEMARDLEMNTRRYKKNEARQKKNQKANEDATEAFKQETGKKYPSHDQIIRYRLWLDQDKRCAYSGKTIASGQVSSAECEVDHILPFKKSLDNSYMNKVLCFQKENRLKADKTPIDAWGGNEDKWNQITQTISRWDKSLGPKIDRFYIKDEGLQKIYFIASQLNDTRYISRLAQDYLKKLGCDINLTKGFVVSQIRHQWGFNSLIGETNKKERTDHRHHAIDAVVIASTSRSLYQAAVKQIKQDNQLKITEPYQNIRKELTEKLKHLIVSHTPQRKLSGALHEETGANYVAKHGGLVYRKALNDPKLNIDKILDKTVKKIVEQHLEDFGGNAKAAFSDDVTVYHKDGKTPIKRVRVEQSKIKTTKNKTAKDILQKNKFGVKDQSGKIFKYMSYGNAHHVEIIQNRKTDKDKIKGEFVTMMKASHRVKGINMPKQPMIKTNHGDEWEFLMALHVNDTVSIENDNGERIFYRVQKLGAGNNRFTIILNTASTLNNKNEALYVSINTDTFNKYKIRYHKVNSIGSLADD